MSTKHRAISAFLFITFLCCLNTATAQSKKGNVIPNGLNSEIYFGMNLDDFRNIMGNNIKLEDVNQKFRVVYSQKTNIPDMPLVIYYFDNEKSKPLYELIILYNDNAQAKKAASLLFGQANYNQTEWRVKIQGFPEIWSWVYKNKLIVAAKIRGSEWFKEWDD